MSPKSDVSMRPSPLRKQAETLKVSEEAKGHSRSARPIIILGMHRSGTSALTGALSAMGVYVGKDEDLTGQSWENPKGFFERRDARAICDALLDDAEADWWKVSAFHPGACGPACDEILERFATLVGKLGEETAASGAWALKEPRLCLLLPLLGDYLEEPVCLFTLRHPLEVARSLWRRNGFPLAIGAALWEVYICAALRGSETRPRLFVSYADLVAAPRETLSWLVEELDNFGVDGLDVTAGAASIDGALRREKGADEDWLTQSQRDLWRALESGQPPVNPVPSPICLEMLKQFETDRTAHDDMSADLKAAQAEKGAAEKAAAATARSAREAHSALRGQITAMNERVKSAESHAAGAAQSSRDLQTALNGQITAMSERVKSAETRAAEAASQAKTLQHALDAQLGAFETCKAESTVHKAERTRLQSELDAALAALTAAMRERDEARDGVENLLGSNSWRMTAPIRRVKTMLNRSPTQAARAASEVQPTETTVRVSPPARAEPPQDVEAASRLPAPNYVPSGERIAVYTAICGGYDTLKFPEIVEPDFDYICFSDTWIDDPGPWQVRGVDYFDPDPTRIARFVKTHPHVYLPDYDKSVWIDGNLVIRQKIGEMARDALNDAPFSAYIHPHRDCIYDEGREVIARGGLDHPGLIKAQLERLRDAGYPEGHGLTETNVLIRRHHDPDVRTLNDAWWRQILDGTKRDQLSLNYVAWCQNFEIRPLARKGVSVRNDPHFERVLHLKDADSYVPSEAARLIAKSRSGSQLVDPFPHVLDAETARKRAETRSVDVVICVHNSPTDVQSCIDSVHAARTDKQRVILVDDGSDEETQAVLEAHMIRHPGDVLVRHDTALGYTRAANAGLLTSESDYVILLNSDTIVPQGWATDLVASAERLEIVGLIGPMSNAASWQSIPKVLTPEGDLAVNDLPAGMSVDEVSELCSSLSDGRPMLTPLVNGFCFAIKRQVIERIGLFDEVAFPQGYGEENDYCLRAGDAGFSCAVSPSSYVFHAKSKSFTHERRRALSKVGSAAFRSKYTKSRVDNAIALMKTHPGLVAMRTAFEATLAEGAEREVRQSRPVVQPLAPLERVAPQVPPGRRLAPSPYISTMDADTSVLAANTSNVQAFRADPHTALGSATWFMPNIGHVYRGGIYTIFRIADAFSRFGGTVNRFVIMDENADLDTIGRELEKEFPALKFELDRINKPEDSADLPATDAGFCTLWTTAYALLNFNQCAAKFYLIQDFEPSFFAAGSLSAIIEQTYRFGFTGICNTSGVGKKYAAYTDWMHAFTPGVDTTRFSPPLRKPDDMQLVFYGRPANDRNAFLLGIEALRKVKAALGDDISIVSAGHPFRESDYNLQGVLRNAGLLPTIDAVADLYRNSHLGLVFMYTPHPSYQPLEFMATGCATVTNFNESTSWLLRDGENALLFPSTVSATADRIISGVEDETLRHRVMAGGLETVAGLNWESELRQIFDYVRNPGPSCRT